MRRLLVVGPYPPPLGGISVHVKRLCELLQEDFSIRVADPYGIRRPRVEGNPDWVLRLGPPGLLAMLRLLTTLRRMRADIVHFHVSAMQRLMLLGPVVSLVLRNADVRVLTIHSGSFVLAYSGLTQYRRRKLRYLLNLFDVIVAVNSAQSDFITNELGIAPHRLVVVNAFIPEVESLPSARIQSLLNLSQQFKAVAVVAGAGEYKYGLHYVVSVFREYPDVLLVVCTYKSHDEEYMSTIDELSRPEAHIQLVRELDESEFNQLLDVSDIFVRATDRDGDSVALREAESKGLLILASDAVERPNGSFLFQTGNERSLTMALTDVLNRVGGDKGKLDVAKYRDSLRARYVELYHRSDP